STQRIAITDETGGEAILHKVMNADAENIRGTLAGIDREVFERCVDEILTARNIYILGVRSSAALASFLSFYFNLMLPNVRLVSVNTVSEVYEQILRAEEGDVMIGISFPRYSKRTVKAMQYVRKQGARAIAITDSHTSPLAETADLALLAKSNMVSFVDSLVAPMSIINALIVAVGMRKKDDVYRSFEKLEQIWDEYEVYEKNG
ncbi:MAG: MurR/RpiR family transcriptional regulator, partial [Clostridia bacterium]|nr:MurR/RpiR family transcriptional regulator [Clostridia bacterium]